VRVGEEAFRCGPATETAVGVAFTWVMVDGERVFFLMDKKSNKVK